VLQLRSFDDAFPNLDANIRSRIFENSGYVNPSQRVSGYNIIGSSEASSNIEPKIINPILNRNLGYIVESISVIQGNPGDVTLLDIYNALRGIRNLKGILYHSSTRNKDIPLFEDATRVTSERQLSPIPDPPLSDTIPEKETVHIRLRDVNFGYSYYRGELALFQNGLCYTLSNFRNLTYLLIPVMREGNFIAVLYFEPIKEGVLIYSLAGAEVSDFVASMLDMNSAIAKRLEVIISWASYGILKKR
jgi:hypothetical protein